MVGWSHCVALTLGLASSVHSFVPPASLVGSSVATSRSSQQPHTGEEHSSTTCGCPACVAGLSTHHQHGRALPAGVGAGAGAGTGVGGGARRGDALVMMARGRRGRGGGGWSRRRRQDANPVEFDKFGFPIPPKKSAKELEEEHRKWMESIEPPEGFDKFDAEAEGYTTEDIASHPLADPAAAEAAAAAAAAAATAQATAAAVAAAEGGDGSVLEEYEPDYDDIPEWGGELLGMDDPLDAPWRVKGEELIRAAVAEAGFEAYDVTWHLHHLNVDVTRAGGAEGGGSLSSDEIVEVTRTIEEALFPHDRELRILQRFHMCVGTPGAKDVLTTEREFQAFRGYEVHVVLRSPINESDPQPVRVGRLMERTPLNTIINVKGRNVTFPTGMVAEVRLPEARHEEDDFEVMDYNSWGSLFTDGRVPASIDCEYELPGLATLGKGVSMVAPDYYEPPPSEEEDEDEEDELGLDGEALGLDDEEVFVDDE